MSTAFIDTAFHFRPLRTQTHSLSPRFSHCRPISRPFTLRAHLHTSCESQSSPTEFVPTTPVSNSQLLEEDSSGALDSSVGGGAGPIPPSGSGGRRGDGRAGDGESGETGDDRALEAVLARRDVSVASLPEDILLAYRNGYITVDNISNYLSAYSNIVSRLFMYCGSGMRNRFLADKLFFLKIMIEVGIGIFGKLSAEFEQRRAAFWREGEFVFANLLTAILADFALVYLPAPSVALTREARGSGIGAWLNDVSTKLPSNIFQTDRPFTLAQRFGGFVLKGSQLFVVGMLCCFAGSALTNGLVYIRERLDKNYVPKTKKPNVLAVSTLYAVFLGASSGSRYQLVNGIENHIFPRLFKTTPRIIEEIATFVLRYGNTFWGSQQWVMFCRFTNVQKTAD